MKEKAFFSPHSTYKIKGKILYSLAFLVLFSGCVSLESSFFENSYLRRTFVEINSFPFFMDIRGKSPDLPILLVLHGGPGWPIDTLFQKLLPELENHFLVVNWHQRGAGRSYYPEVEEEEMQLSTFLSDTEKIIQYLLEEYDQEKLFLLGHSWGTVLGSLVTADHPQWIYAYIGVSQLTNTMLMVKESKKSAVRSAYERGRISLSRDIASLTPEDLDKDWYKDAILYRDYLTKIEGTVYGSKSYYYFVRHYLRDSSYTWQEKFDIIDGLGFSIYNLYPDMLKADLYKDASSFDVPVFILQGAYDLLTLPELTKAFFDTLKAPKKRFFLFEESAHSPLFEEPDQFISVMLNEVLPLAKSNPGYVN